VEALLGKDGGGIAFGRARNDGFGAGFGSLGGASEELGAADSAEAALLKLTVAGPLDGMAIGFLDCSAGLGFGWSCNGTCFLRK
jgi:hypothetical protein